jgi:hypothetical protein
MRKTFLISIVSSYLTLCMGVSAQGAYTISDYTTLDVPGASYTRVYGIDGGNIVGRHTLYSDGSYHGFIATIPIGSTMEGTRHGN